ncbi:MAG TPA: UDP-glucose/GDP-mannose dehydrogenase family protein [Pyrinomonadaceae bacterium]|jgi:GDP-mannose 6-dehydrogenase|nr:UDP-glucose/GDP-mannose dehydrogenase family protein [Pyrinomonadaceae bacterium]
MKLSIFGLGYVGSVSAACFARDGHEVIGVDVNPLKVEIINSGRSPIVEPQLNELIAEAVKAGRLRATTDAADAISSSDVSLVCVGTPGNANGSLDLTHIKNSCKQIGVALSTVDRNHVVVIRSTLLPGSIERHVIPTLEVYSGKRAGKDFGVAINPEFLREGTSVYDFDNPPFTLIGADDENTSSLLGHLYSRLNAPLFTLRIKEAEMVKYTCNCFHALKVAFANEIGNICKPLAVDSHRVMEVFCQDNKLNLSPYYLKPGFAFGGSCLPKDLRAMTYKAKELDVEIPVLSSILLSNERQIERAINMVLATGRKNIGVLGLSFKQGTDDLRESPIVTVIERLLGKGLRVLIYDRDVQLARVFGANKEYIEREIPHISELMRPELESVVNASEVIVIANKSKEFLGIKDLLRSEQTIIDLVRLFDSAPPVGNYSGIGW